MAKRLRRQLWELDMDLQGKERPKNDKERDDICKALTLEDQIALMDKYGYAWPVHVKVTT